MKQVCFGVDIGGTTVKLGLVSREGELLDKREFPSFRDLGATFDDIADHMRQVMEDFRSMGGVSDEYQCVGAGVGVSPGWSTAPTWAGKMWTSPRSCPAGQGYPSGWPTTPIWPRWARHGRAAARAAATW